jgi:hypothetical protein
MRALPRNHSAPLRRQVTRFDGMFLHKTLNNPFVDPSLPWWFRRT